MKKLIIFSSLLIFLSGCYDIKYDTFEKSKVIQMMIKFQDLQKTKNLPPLIQVFDMESKLAKKLAGKGIKIFLITGAIYLDGPYMGQHAIVVQLKKDGGSPSEFIDFRTIVVAKGKKGEAPLNIKGICPEPPDCSVTIDN